MRFLAEAVWYPTALLPSQGVHWEAIDDVSAKARLTDGAITVSLDFRFDGNGLVTGTRAAARHRMVNGKLVVTHKLIRIETTCKVVSIPCSRSPAQLARILLLGDCFEKG